MCQELQCLAVRGARGRDVSDRGCLLSCSGTGEMRPCSGNCPFLLDMAGSGHRGAASPSPVGPILHFSIQGPLAAGHSATCPHSGFPLPPAQAQCIGDVPLCDPGDFSCIVRSGQRAQAPAGVSKPRTKLPIHNQLWGVSKVSLAASCLWLWAGCPPVSAVGEIPAPCPGSLAPAGDAEP